MTPLGYRADYGTAIEHGPITNLPSDDDAIDQGAPPTHLGRSRPRARLRGRFYLGPLEWIALASSSAGPGNIAGALHSLFKSDLAGAFNALAQTFFPGAPDQFNLVQWSRRSAAVNAVRWYYVNEFAATVRRRTDVTQARVHNWVGVV